MKNTNEILERILLNMKYDSKKTLSENNESLIKKKLMHDILTETTTDPPRKKLKPSITVEPLQRGGFNFDVTTKNVPYEIRKNHKLVTTKDYNGNTMKFYGEVWSTVGDYFGEFIDKLNSNPKAYILSDAKQLVPKYDNYKKLTGYGDSNRKASPGYVMTYGGNQTPIKSDWKIVYRGYVYTNDFIGKTAEACRSYYQNERNKLYGQGMEQENLNDQYTRAYLEPKQVLKCVKESIQRIIDTAKPDTPYEFTAYSDAHTLAYTRAREYSYDDNGWHRYFLQYSCNKYYSARKYYNQDRWNLKTGKRGVWEHSKIKGPCSRGVILYGYQERDFKQWFGIKSGAEDEGGYTIDDLCDWLKNPNSVWYYKGERFEDVISYGVEGIYQKLVYNKVIGDYRDIKRKIEACIPKDVENLKGDKTTSSSSWGSTPPDLDIENPITPKGKSKESGLSDYKLSLSGG